MKKYRRALYLDADLARDLTRSAELLEISEPDLIREAIASYCETVMALIVPKSAKCVTHLADDA